MHAPGERRVDRRRHHRADHGDGYHATVVNAGTYTATGSWTLSLVCEHDYANSDDGRWQGDDTLLQAIDQGPISATTT